MHRCKSVFSLGTSETEAEEAEEEDDDDNDEEEEEAEAENNEAVKVGKKYSSDFAQTIRYLTSLSTNIFKFFFDNLSKSQSGLPKSVHTHLDKNNLSLILLSICENKYCNRKKLKEMDRNIFLSRVMDLSNI